MEMENKEKPQISFLAKKRERQQRKRQEESPNSRENRLAKMREATRRRRQEESKEERAARLLKKRTSEKRRIARKKMEEFEGNNDLTCELCTKTCYPNQASNYQIDTNKCLAYLPPELLQKKIILLCHQCKSHLLYANEDPQPTGGYWNNFVPGVVPPTFQEHINPYRRGDVSQNSNVVSGVQNDSDICQSSSVTSHVKLEPQVEILEPTNYAIEFNTNELPVKAEIKEEPIYEVVESTTYNAVNNHLYHHESSADITLGNRLTQWASRIGIMTSDFDDLLEILTQANVDISKTMNTSSKTFRYSPTSAHSSNIFKQNLAKDLENTNPLSQNQYIEDNSNNISSQAAIGEILTQVRSIEQIAEIRYTQTMQEFAELRGNVCENQDSSTQSDGTGEVFPLKSKKDLELVEDRVVTEPDYMNKMLHKELAQERQTQRLNIPTLSNKLRKSIHKVMDKEKHIDLFDQKGARTYCNFCDWKKKRMTITYCSCGKSICGQHQIKKCPDCENVDEDQKARNRRLQREKVERWRNRQSQATLAQYRKARANAQKLRRQAETPEQVQARRQASAEAQRMRRQNATPEEIQERRKANAEARRLRRQAETPEQALQRRQANAERMRLRRIDSTDKAYAEAQRLRRQAETPEQTLQRRQANAERMRLKRLGNAESKRLRWQAETPSGNDLTSSQDDSSTCVSGGSFSISFLS